MALFQRVCELDLEGIVAKQKFGPYVTEREQSTWFKILNREYSQMQGREVEARRVSTAKQNRTELQGYRRNSYLSANAGMLMTMNLKLLLGSSARTETRSRRLATVTLLTFAQATV